MSRIAVLLALVLTQAALAASFEGIIDTIGGTTFDNQNSGPPLGWLEYDPEYGIHATWMYSAQAQGSGWPDRTIRYNFYDKNTSAWNWIDTAGFMGSGLNSQNRRTGFGSMTVNPSDHVPLIACHYSLGGMPPQYTPIVARDLLPGIGMFDYCEGEPTLTGYFLPVVAASENEVVHLLLIKFQASDNLFYSRATTWCDWQNPSGWSQTGASAHNIAASHDTPNVLATWMTGSNESLALNYRFSTDAGESWGPIQALEPPAAYLGDTITVCSRGASVLFEPGGDWLLATTLLPAVADSAYQNPAELWLYSSATSEWHRIHRAESHRLAGGFGSFTSICCRPTLGRNPGTGRLFVAWEQFDSSNVEGSTNLLRADIWLAYSDDGSNWTQPTRITEPDQSSKRLPCIASNCSGDSVAVLFEQDLIAGFNSDEVGAVSNNPICVWRGRASGIAEADPSPVIRTDVRPSLGPSFRFDARAIRIYDLQGRLVRNLGTAPGCVWDGTDDSGRRLGPGCYFARFPEGLARLILTE